MSRPLSTHPNPVSLEAAMIQAARQGDVATMQRLVRIRPELVNCQDRAGRCSTPLHFAAGYNRVQVCQFLLDHGAATGARDRGGLVPLHNACCYGHGTIAKLLLTHGADASTPDLWHYTPLHEAASKGRFEITRMLLEHGANRLAKTVEGKIPLDLVPR